MLEIFYTSQFKKDFKKSKKQGRDLDRLKQVISLIQKQEPLAEKFRVHNLSGDYVGFRECHINPDWLLMYKVDEDQLILMLARLGSHSDLF